MIASNTSLLYQSIMDSRPNNVAVGCTTTYDSATMKLVSLFRETSLKNGINLNSLGSPLVGELSQI